MGLPWFNNNNNTSNKTTAPPPSVSDTAGFRTLSGTTCLVTGSSGLCGARLVELLLERGCQHVVAFDLQAPNDVLQERFDAIQRETGGTITVLSGSTAGDLTSEAAVRRAFELVAGHAKDKTTKSYDIIFHLGALVGPFYQRDTYHAVNHYGTIRLLEMARQYNCPRFVYSSSPSTRFDGHADIVGARDCDLPMPKQWLAMYAEAKAFGEMAVSKAHGSKCNDTTMTLQTISVAPHQVYGPHDALMLPNLLETAGSGRLRIFGSGQNKISVTYVDNYCHGLLCGADALVTRPDTVGGKFYIVTDEEEEPVLFWEWLNQAVVGMGFVDLQTKWHLPVWLLYGLAYICNAVGYVTNRKFKLNPFNVTMLIIHRHFDIQSAKRDLEYRAVKARSEAWAQTIEWFRVHWLPGYRLKQQGQTARGGGLLAGGVSSKGTTKIE